MAKIIGKFAPLLQELGDDERFILECSDFEKLMYILIIFTTHMTRHQAPIDPRYYQRRYGIKARSHQLRHAIDTLLKRFPKLKCVNGKLSLLNSATYDNEILTKNPLEEEREEDIDIERPKPKSVFPAQTDFINSLKNLPAYKNIDIDRELSRMDAWLLTPKGRGRKKTKRFIVNWLNRIDTPIESTQGKDIWEKTIKSQ